MGFDYERERQEAIDAGQKALYSLKQAKAELSSAKNWGIVDILGGGFVTDIIKHSKMNRAQNCMEQAKRDLQSFSKELSDVSSNIDLGFNTADLLSFADFLFDGFLTDMLMQSRINDARAKVDTAIERIEYILARL